MNSFLHDVATSLLENYGDNLSNVEVVFVSNRAAIYFKSICCDLGVKPPRTTTIDSLILKECEMLKVEHNFLLISKLYSIYSKYHNEESFEDFYAFGKLLLSDFDAIDKYLVDAKALFTIVSDTKELDFSIGIEDSAKDAALSFWKSFDFKSATMHSQREFARVWSSLYDIYSEFNEILDNEKIAYKGKIYRWVASKFEGFNPLIINENSSIPNNKKYIFVGLNALSRSEEIVLLALQKENKADFIWDYDPKWRDYKAIEADFFIEKNIEKFPQAQYFKTNIFDHKKVKIEVLTSPSDATQAKIASMLLSEHYKSVENGERTAVILPDEALLVPILNSIPTEFQSVNISMGYPIAITLAATLLNSLLVLQKRIKISGYGSKYLIYRADVEAVVSHPFFSDVVDRTQFDNLTQLYFSVEELCELFEPLETLWQCTENSYRVLHKYLVDVFEFVAQLIENKETAELSQQLIYIDKIKESLVRVKTLVDGTTEKFSSKIYLKLLLEDINSQSIEFEGYSGQGLQIIGILESRTLDFDRIIMLSLSDDIFPSSRPDNSYIPQLLLQGFGMPSIAEKSAIWSYYFYRLLQRCENISLLYCNTADGLSTGEPSRYILQLKYCSPFVINNRVVDFGTIASKPKERITKILTQEQAEKLANTTFWPSMINRYLRCKLSFYYQYVLKLKELNVQQSEITAIESGNIVHNTLEMIYKELINKHQLPKLLKNMSVGDIEKCVDIIIDDILGNKLEAQAAMCAIVRNNSIRALKGVIDFDAKSQSVDSVIEVEKEYSCKLGNYQIKGVIDRIDRLIDGSVRVIDYKSGTVDTKTNSLAELFTDSELSKKSNAALTQILIYSLLVYKNQDVDVQPSIYATRKLSMSEVEDNVELVKIEGDFVQKISVEQYQEIETELISLLDQICSTESEFVPCSDIKKCEYCPYWNLCY